jgi:hypothetical protein
VAVDDVREFLRNCNNGLARHVLLYLHALFPHLWLGQGREHADEQVRGGRGEGGEGGEGEGDDFQLSSRASVSRPARAPRARVLACACVCMHVRAV